MVATAHNTMLYTPRGTACPKIVRQDFLIADPERNIVVAEVALGTNARLPHDDGYCYSVLCDVIEECRDGGALVIQYRNDAGEVSARCIFPSWLTVTKDRNLVCWAYCTLRREWRSFRLDRVLDCHPMSLPCEAA